MYRFKCSLYLIPIGDPSPRWGAPLREGSLVWSHFPVWGSVIRIPSAAEPLSDEERLVPNRVTEKAILQKCGVPQFCKMAFFGGLTPYYLFLLLISRIMDLRRKVQK